MDIEQVALKNEDHLGKLPVSPDYLEKLSEGDEDLQELLEEMTDKCKDYAISVMNLDSYLASEEGIDPEERQELDNSRTRSHNATIDSVKIFIRNLRIKSKDTSWAQSIDLNNRSQVGRFALLYAFADTLQKVQK